MPKLTLSIAKKHIQQCNAACQKNPDSLLAAFYLALASQQVRSATFWPNVKDAFQVYKAKGAIKPGGLLSMFHMNHKGIGLNQVRDNIETLYKSLQDMSVDDAHTYLVKNVTGLSVVKAGFVIQLTRGRLGCMDTVNARRFEYPPNFFSNMGSRKNGPEEYRNLLRSDSRFQTVRLWRDWCVHVANEQPPLDAFTLSKMHVDAVVQPKRKVLLHA